MFRFVLVVAMAVLLLPTDAGQQEKLRERITAGAAWAATFCDRNGPTCKTAGEYWVLARAKAQFAARMVGEIAFGQHGAGPSVRQIPAKPMPTPSAATGTLTPDDVRPAWRPPTGRTGA